MFPTPTPVPLISPETIQQGNQSILNGISMLFDQFTIHFIIGLFILAAIGFIFLKKRYYS